MRVQVVLQDGRQIEGSDVYEVVEKMAREEFGGQLPNLGADVIEYRFRVAARARRVGKTCVSTESNIGFLVSLADEALIKQLVLMPSLDTPTVDEVVYEGQGHANAG